MSEQFQNLTEKLPLTFLAEHRHLNANCGVVKLALWAYMNEQTSNNVDWNTLLFDSEGVDEMCNCVIEAFFKIPRECIQTKMATVRNIDLSWFNIEQSYIDKYKIEKNQS